MPIYRGTYYSKDIQFKNRSTGLPIDVSLWEFEGILKNAAGEDLLSMSTAEGHFTVFDGENGWLRFALSEAQTEALAAGPVFFGLYRTDGENGTQRFARCSDVVLEKD